MSDLQDITYTELYKYTDIEISSYGKFRKNKIITDPSKFKSTSKCFKKDGIQKEYVINQLIALAFIGPRPSEKHIVRHCDNDKYNYHYTNLEWTTISSLILGKMRKNK